MVAIPLSYPSNDVPILGPIGVGVATLGTVWSEILASDPNRRGVIFHNPGANTLFVAPSNLGVQSTAGAVIVYPGYEVEFLAEDERQNINTAWMGWVDVGANQPVSILNFTGTNASVPAPLPLASLDQGSVITSPLASGSVLTTAVSSVIGSNAQRRGITFSNPGSIPVCVMPSNLSVQFGVAGSITILPGQTKTFMARPRSKVRVNCGWSAAAQSSTNPLSVLEWLG